MSATPAYFRRRWFASGMDGRRTAEAASSPADAIYGTLVAAAVLAAEDGHESLFSTAGAVLASACVYWLAHGYSDMLPQRAQHVGQRGHEGHGRDIGLFADFRHALWGRRSVVAGAGVLVVVLLLVGVVASVNTSINVALAFACLELLLWGALAARTADLPWRTAVSYALGSALLGVIIAVLKANLH